MSEPIAYRRLHPATLVSRTLRIIPEAVGGMAAYGAVIAQAELGRVLLLASFGLVVAAVAASLSWWRFRYAVGEREIVIESGVISHKRRVIPFERVQDIGIERRLLARLFGTATVKIETGGSAADEGHLDSIALADAHRLRDLLRERKASAGSAVPASEEEPPEPLLFAMGLGRVLFSGLFNFSLVFVAGLFALLQNGEELGLYDPKDLWLPLESGGRRLWLIASLWLLLAVLLLGVAAGVLRTAARDFGFRLTRAVNGLRRRRGLFTLSEALIPVRRIQLAQIESGLVARALGWHRLDFQTLGADRREQGLQAAAPFAQMDEILPILSATGYPDPAAVAQWTRAPRRSILRRAALPAAGAAAALVLAMIWQPAAAAAGALLLLLALAAPLRWSGHRHSLGERALLVTGGALTRQLRIAPYERTQAIGVRASPLQRVLRLATVAVDTAGAPSLRGLAIVDLDANDATEVAARLLILFRQHSGARA